ncbi:MAG: IS5 family transposase, partial [Candidatus Zambryskibacteria bacterium]|nr:IS5 family transposase [Candidatus Zambryskibacteria bacterium]
LCCKKKLFHNKNTTKRKLGGVFGTMEDMKHTKDIIKSTKTKKKYKLKNWGEYNKALIKRGSLTLWISPDIERWWYGEGHNTYSDRAIEVMLTFKALYRLPLRATTGFVQSLFDLLHIPLSVPDYTTISRRAEDLGVILNRSPKDVTDLILDSTGAKVFGEGEWKVRKHGWSKRRVWKKLHIGIDSKGEIRAVVVTDNNIHDSTPILDILKQEDAPITDFYGDGAFDTWNVYHTLMAHGVTGFHVPPQKNAVIHMHANNKHTPYPRDVNLRAIRTSTRKQWKQNSGYHTRSLAETCMFRYKTTFGHHMSFRTDESQRNEVVIKCNILNTFHFLGTPESYVT